MKLPGAVTLLKAIGVLDQNVVGGGSLTRQALRSGVRFPAERPGTRIGNGQVAQYADVWQRLEGAAHTFNQAGKLDYMLLSVAAKTYFMLGEKKGPATEPELAALAPRFGWNVTAKEIRQAAEYLNKLGLVQVAGN